ncbi:PREDICTED: RNA-binding protein 42-like [Nicrophorus vespilloides]|uniref:RNA-binding protein 42 n=1 Tax=Nicrophorus vespilloides TaxID=110193 RepID=A0ABM1N2D9_NICVS|nr:PREDICTED: RNA-binding protein 42-like [Nicrophorus vespilloides]
MYRGNFIEDEMRRFEAEISGYNNPGMLMPQHVKAQPAVLSGKSVRYSTPKAAVAAAPQISQQQQQPQQQQHYQPQASTSQHFDAIHSAVQEKLKKLKNEKINASVAISQGKASSAMQSFAPGKKARTNNKKLMRSSGGHTWEDHSLADWSDDDFRIFCGDLGNDVTDELLTRTFKIYPSFMKAKVIRDKRSNKSKGYGFVSFKQPDDFTKAMREMNGKYVGSRPIKLRKSSWRNRSFDVVRKKEQEKQELLQKLG